MYRLLIADDEPIEREGLECMVKRYLPDTFEFIHAANGRMAIEYAEKYRPHIAIMDINMPGIGGLEALREMKERLPGTRFIVVTAYDYFAYAQEALSLGAKEYILKPAKREQLIAVFQRLVREIEQESESRARELDLRDKVSQLLPVAENELALMLMLDHSADASTGQLADWLGMSLKQGSAIVIAYSGEAYARMKNKIYDHLRSFIKSHGPGSVVSPLIDRHMAIFLHQPAISEHDWRRQTKQLSEQLTQVSEQTLGLKASIGIGSLHSGADGFRTSYYEAVFASTLPERTETVCHFDELKQQNVLLPSPGAADGNGADVQQSYVASALRQMREQREEQTLSVLDRAKQYIIENFTEDLSLEDVSEVVHLNPHYFSKIFKQQCGETFIDYVTRLRIEKAIALIRSTPLSLKEICFEVGYKDPNYFSRVFKKITGVSPTSYKDQS
ncbi:AraC family transcriptional regulator [Paenibacillus sp. FSL R7-0337]|uniref:response regulator transcription factor n=1 Tax=Paenibacillus sp. FSL R7-0337 TaxID=1926588 RepID=UPI00096E6ABE|nr:AraC family transcriptional regulator [Paenibacillus sp. FSL R7-0337]OMF94864.1 DNA-binding response regulator [Paenibacillus sp. FSL R7-0337]